MAAAIVPLGAATRGALHAFGWVALPDLLPPAAFRELRRDVLELVTTDLELRGASLATVTGTVHLDLEPFGDDLLASFTGNPLLRAVLADVVGPAWRRMALHYRGPAPGFGAQTLHADWTAPAPDGVHHAATAILALEDFTPTSGPTNVVPGSHRGWGSFRPRDPRSHHPDERLLLGPAGTCFVLNGHVLHSGTRNESAGVRHSVLLNVLREGSSPGQPAAPMRATPSAITSGSAQKRSPGAPSGQ